MDIGGKESPTARDGLQGRPPLKNANNSLLLKTLAASDSN
jgi:hypothetical protein